MKKAEPSRVAAALQYLQQMRDRAADFGGGVVDTLADRARDVGGLAYEAFTSDPNIGRMTTAEFADAAAARAPTPRLDATAQGVGALGKALVTQPVQTAKAVVVDPVVEAFKSPRAMGQFAGEFVNPLRIAAALRKTAPIAELDVYHGTPHRFEPTEENPLGEFDASKIGTGEGAQIYGQGIYLIERPEAAATYKRVNLKKDGKIEEPYAVANAAAFIAKEKTGVNLFDAERVSHHILDWVRKNKKPENFLKNNQVQESLRPVYEAALTHYKGYSKNEGSLYKADLPDEMIDRMIDGEKPINQQSAQVQKALEKAGINIQSSALAGPMVRGQEKHLQKFGIPGLFHTENKPKGPRNFVVFPGEEKKVKILKRD
jgi:hypothetical protein